MLDIFPDACIVQTHRDPLTSISSIASLTYSMMQLREPAHTMIEHGRAIRVWLHALEKAEAERARRDPARFFDLPITEFEADPVASVEHIYQHFGLPVSEQARTAWRALATSDPRGGHGAHRYSPADFGLSKAEMVALAPRYCARQAALATTVRH